MQLISVNNAAITTQPTWPGRAQLGLPTWEQDELEPGFQVGSKWASPLIKKNFIYLCTFLILISATFVPLFSLRFLSKTNKKSTRSTLLIGLSHYLFSSQRISARSTRKKNIVRTK